MFRKVLFALNPISPPNWIVLVILYFTLLKKLKKDERTKKPYVKWPIFASVYLVIMIPVYYILCFIAQFIQPLRLIAFLC